MNDSIPSNTASPTDVPIKSANKTAAIFCWLILVFVQSALGILANIFLFSKYTIIIGNLFTVFSFMATIPVWGMGIVLFLLAGFSKKLYRPPVFIMSWTIFILILAHIFYNTQAYSSFMLSSLSEAMFSCNLFGLFLNIIQLLVSSVCLWQTYTYIKKPSPLPKTKPFRFILSHAAIFIIGCPVYIYLLVFAIIHSSSGGFISVSPTGIHSVTRSYELNGKQVLLVGMSHIGNSDFYKFYADLSKNSDPETSAILTEGVTDNETKLKYNFDYTGISKMVGLKSQNEVHKKQTKAPTSNRIHADVDISTFSEPTLKILNSMGQFLSLVNKNQNKFAVIKAFLEFNKRSAKWSSKDYNAFANDVLKKRNDHLYSVMQDNLPKYEILIVPWGAAHLNDISQRLEKEGFQQKDQRTHSIINFF